MTPATAAPPIAKRGAIQGSGITHNFGVVADICDRVVVMQSGAVVEQGPVRDIIRRPTHAYTQELLGSMVKNAQPHKTARPALTPEER